MEYYVYILQSQLNLSFYKGHTDDLNRRVAEHNAGNVAYSKKFKPWNLVWFTAKPTKNQALALEMKLKNLSRNRLIDFINKYPVDSHSPISVIPSKK
ncbi:MAG: GIY-YIG nuclease family protein [Cyclobacteriaceae bacterium]|nr:GIY-YIG nuclease family protein [Cyclobacteriaceae bacterium]